MPTAAGASTSGNIRHPQEHLARQVALAEILILAIQSAPVLLYVLNTPSERGFIQLFVLCALVAVNGIGLLLKNPKIQSWLATIGALVAGLTVTTLMGINSVGPLWLLAAVNLSAAFFGHRGIIFSILAGTLGILPLILQNTLQTGVFSEPSRSLIFTALNIILLPLLSAFPLMRIMGDLRESLDEADTLRNGLEKEQSKRIHASHELLRQARMRRSMQETLRRRDAKLYGILSQSDDLAIILDEHGLVLFAAGGGDQALGWAAEELIGKELADFLHPDESAAVIQQFRKLLETPGGNLEGRLKLRTRDGSYVIAEARAGNHLEEEAVHGIVISVRDVTRLHTTEERLEFFECYDPLTELPNRSQFSNRLTEEIARAHEKGRIFGVLTVGLDRFKRINDFYGTEIGDRVLKEVGNELSAAYRAGDLVSRLRGDKFLILLSDLQNTEDITELVRKAQKAISRRYTVPDGEVNIDCTLGAALYPHDGNTADELIKNAETAMYMAKEEGRGSWRLFDPLMNQRLIERQKLEDELNIAVEGDRFVAWFQPKVDRLGGVGGMEALVRWPLANGQVRAPASFIETAERTGAIIPIGNAMIRAACNQILSWQSLGLKAIPISVNLSPIQFRQKHLVQTIVQIIRYHGVDPRLIELELTESGLMGDEREGIRKLNELRELGFTISIDDFGTGYSSFSKLKDFPINTVKIDKSFIDPLPMDSRALTIARAIIDLAHALECSVVAEGVEKTDQLTYLSEAGCDLFQGYLFSRPLTAEAATSFIQQAPVQSPLIS